MAPIQINGKSKVTTLLDFNVDVEPTPIKIFELICEKKYWPSGVEPIRVIVKSQFYQALVFRTEQERNRVATSYKKWLNKQRGLS